MREISRRLSRMSPRRARAAALHRPASAPTWWSPAARSSNRSSTSGPPTPRRRRPRHPRGHPPPPDGGDAEGAGREPAACGQGDRAGRCQAPGQDRARAHRALDALARTPAQRPLRQASQGRGLSQPRGLQVDRARRALRLPEGREARDRSRHRPRRLDAGRAAQRAPKAAVVGIDLLPADPIDGVDDPADGLHGRGRARRADGGAGRRARPGAVRHGGEHRRPSADRPLAHDGAGRGGARISPARC